MKNLATNLLASIERPILSCEEALRSKARAFDFSANGMALLDLDGRWIEVNDAFCRMMGATRSSLLRRSYDLLTFAEDLVPSRDVMKQLLAGDLEQCEFQKRYRRSDGEVIHVQIQAAIIRSDDLGEDCIVTEVRDITAEVRTSDALAESQSHIGLALAGADMGIWHMNVRTGAFNFSEAASRLLGYHDGEIEQGIEQVLELSHPSDRKELKAAMLRHLEGQSEVFDRVLRLRRRSGGYMWLLASGQVTRRDDRDRPLQVSGTVMDVTKWKELERQLTEKAATDALTGLLNRRSGVAALDRAIEQSDERQLSISMILLDVDNFKSINDQLGHDTGDQVLASLGEILRSSRRMSDRAIRWGGEEFAVVLSDTDSPGAVAAAERVCESLDQIVQDIEGLEALSASVGVVTRFPDESGRAMMKRADELMYRAKRAGRDRILSDQTS